MVWGKRFLDQRDLGGGEAEELTNNAVDLALGGAEVKNWVRYLQRRSHRPWLWWCQ
jgi:hypothetical protein